MGRKPPSSRKQKSRQELVEDIFAAHAVVAGTVEAAGPALPSFIREGYISLTEATATLDGGWPELRQHLCDKRVQGFIVDNENRLRRMPADDWASPKNNDASLTGWAVKLNRAIVGGSDLEGFALVKASGLTTIKPTARQSTIKAETDCRKWLVILMSNGQRKTNTKPDYRTEAIERFGVSIRAFDRAWGNAIAETGNVDWRKSGRRKS